MAFCQIIGRSVNSSRVLCRNLSTEKVSDPIQKLFLDKISEFKTTDKGLDQKHEKMLSDEMLRLKRVYKVEDESKIAQLHHKFDAEHSVNLHDIDTNKTKRAQIHSGEYQKRLSAEPKPVSALLATIPDQTKEEFHLPPLNKPDIAPLLQGVGKAPAVPEVSTDMKPDYDFVGDKMTPESLQREIGVFFGPNMPTIHDEESPQRDTKNFPRFIQRLDTPPTRYHIIPESWFRIFYNKTGVTGPYVFAASLGTFVLSKEWLVIEHELLTGFSSGVIFTYAIIKYGPRLKEWAVKGFNEQLDGWDKWQHGNIALMKSIKEHYTKELDKSSVIENLYNVRRQDVEVQLECEYRKRLKTIYDDTKRRLDYLVAVADSQRQVHQSNMFNWVISNVLSSIGAKQENEVLDNCVLNLKQLASKHAKAI